MKTRRKILLKGYYDFFNFGDELLLLAIVDFIKNEFKDASGSVDLYIERQLYSIESLRYKTPVLHEFTEPIKRFVKTHKKNGGNQALLKILTNALFLVAFFDALIFRLTGQAFFFKSLFRFFKSLDVIHYVGGGYFTSIWDFSLSYLIYELYITRLAKWVNPQLKIVATGIGVGPLTSPVYNRIFKYFISTFDAIHVREEVSLEHIQTCRYPGKFSCLGDDVQLFLPLFREYRQQTEALREREKVFGLNLKHHNDQNYTAYKTYLENLIVHLDSAGWKVEFFSFGTDHEALSVLSPDVRKKLVIHKPYEMGLDNFLKQFSRMRAGLGFAYHFSVLSALFEIPVINVYMGEYYKQKIGQVIKTLSPGQKIIAAEELTQLDLESLLSGYSLDDAHVITSFYEKMRRQYRHIYTDFMEQQAS